MLKCKFMYMSGRRGHTPFWSPRHSPWEIGFQNGLIFRISDLKNIMTKSHNLVSAVEAGIWCHSYEPRSSGAERHTICVSRKGFYGESSIPIEAKFFFIKTKNNILVRWMRDLPTFVHLSPARRISVRNEP